MTGRSLEDFAQLWARRDEAAAGILDELAAEASSGDSESLSDLLGLVLNHGLARPAIRRVLIDQHDVEDAEQTTLAVLAHRMGQFQGRSKFTTWLHQVALNEARMLVRARERRPSVAVAEPLPGSAYLTRVSSFVADRVMVRDAVDALPDEFRAPLLLREYEGLSYDEIAVHLDCPVGTVRSRLSRARAALARALQPHLNTVGVDPTPTSGEPES
jgi:RNA polymerase sigma-70 factor, ECF subfamily